MILEIVFLPYVKNAIGLQLFLKKVESFQCPVCLGEEVALIPLCKNEKYEYSIEPVQGLQIKFSPRG